MTIEQRTLVPLTDITGIEYACNHCGSRYMVATEHFDTAISQCPNCRTEIVSTKFGAGGGKTNDTSALYDLVHALRDVVSRDIPVKFVISGSLGRVSGDMD
jgi:DNA-directed RNA polymerase subunit RPC12/RpoP